MRQVGDTLVWLGLIVVLAAVVYFTPQFANYFAGERDALQDGRGQVAYRTAAEPVEASAE